ncbi:aminotransferase class IV [Salinispira pacifica]
MTASHSAQGGCIVRILDGGRLRAASYAAGSLAEAAVFEPDDGVYTLANTRNGGRVAGLDMHFDRLADSAAREGIPLRLDRSAVRTALRQMVGDSGWDDVRFRITIPRTGTPITLSIEPFAGLPPNTYVDGVRCVTVHDTVRFHAQSKTTAWLHLRVGISEHLPAGVTEGILCDSGGRMLEGISSNFYAVYHNAPRRVRTAADGVLPGIAQRILFSAAEGVCAVDLRAPECSEIDRFSEAFITSSSRDIVPVSEIDGIRIGEGRRGALTAELQRSYADWIARNLEPL